MSVQHLKLSLVMRLGSSHFFSGEKPYRAKWWNLVVENSAPSQPIHDLYGQIKTFIVKASEPGNFVTPVSGHRLPWSWWTGHGDVLASLADNTLELNVLSRLKQRDDSNTFAIPGPRQQHERAPEFLRGFTPGLYEAVISVGSLSGAITPAETAIRIEYRGAEDLVATQIPLEWIRKDPSE